MTQDIRIFAYYEFALGFGRAEKAKNASNTERGRTVQRLIADDAFLYATQIVSFGFNCIYSIYS
jgi:hypothetical protein